jgi:Glutathione S-transferase, C-terminal domain
MSTFRPSGRTVCGRPASGKRFAELDRFADVPFMGEGRQQPPMPAAEELFCVKILFDTKAAIAVLNNKPPGVRNRLWRVLSEGENVRKPRPLHYRGRSRSEADRQERLTWLDGLMDGKPFIWSDRVTMADILLFAAVDFFARVGQPINPGLANIGAWYARAGAPQRCSLAV